MTHWGPTYYEMTHQPTAEELERKRKSDLRQEAFPNVSFTDPDKDMPLYEWALRRKSDGKIVAKLNSKDNEVRNFGPMGHCPEGYELVYRSLWPTEWEVST